MIKESCKKCRFYKGVQGSGKMGICRFEPKTYDKHERDWCGKFEVNLDKYHVSGKKIYTRVNTRIVNPDSDSYRNFSGDDNAR